MNNRNRKQSRRRRTRRPNTLSLYNRSYGDTSRFHFHGAVQIANTSAGTNSGLVLISPFGGGVNLASAVPNFASIATSFQKYMITRLNLKYEPMIPSTIGALWALTFEPRAQGAGAPSGLADATQGAHSITGNQNNGKSLTLNPSLYFNDWKSCTVESDLDDSTCGVIQTYGLNTIASGTGVGVLTVDFDVVFTGLV